MATLKEILDEELSHLKIDAALAKKIYHFGLAFINKNEEHLGFFGGNLLGVHAVRFLPRDVTAFFTDILDADDVGITERVIAEAPGINQDFKVSSDTLNQVLTYLIHRFHTERKLSEKDREFGKYNCALLFFYRCCAAIMSDWFKYPADTEVAQAAYARLNNKFLIKKLGSWAALCDYRAKEMIHRTSPGMKDGFFNSFEPDQRVIEVINDSQGRVRSIMKYYYREFEAARVAGERITSMSATTTDMEGEEIVREKTGGVDNKVATFKTLVADKHAFIKLDLLGVVRDINGNTSLPAIERVLAYIHDSYADKAKAQLVDEFISMTLVYSYWLIDSKIEGVHKRDYASLLVKLKNLYLSTRLVDDDIERIRELGERIVLDGLQKKRAHPSLIKSTRTAVILYLSLRCLVEYG